MQLSRITERILHCTSQPESFTSFRKGQIHSIYKCVTAFVKKAMKYRLNHYQRLGSAMLRSSVCSNGSPASMARREARDQRELGFSQAVFEDRNAKPVPMLQAYPQHQRELGVDPRAQQHKGGKKENNGSTDIDRPSKKVCHFFSCRLGVIKAPSGEF